MKDLAVLRIRKNVPGVGRKIANHFGAQEVVCGYNPTNRLEFGTVVFNYGRSQLPIWLRNEEHHNGVKVLNRPEAVRNSVDKRQCLGILNESNVPSLEMTEDRDEAMDWNRNGEAIIVRHIVNGKQGKGVEFVEEFSEELPHAPLYTKFYDKTHEFRVHVFQGKVIALVQKKMMGAKKQAARGIEEVDMLTRNHKKGWVFAVNDLVCDFLPTEDQDNGRAFIEWIATEATRVIGLDYCGVDILARYDEDDVFIDAVVCETNSAPGMSGKSTFSAYVNAIQNVLEA